MRCSLIKWIVARTAAATMTAAATTIAAAAATAIVPLFTPVRAALLHRLLIVLHDDRRRHISFRALDNGCGGALGFAVWCVVQHRPLPGGSFARRGLLASSEHGLVRK